MLNKKIPGFIGKEKLGEKNIKKIKKKYKIAKISSSNFACEKL